MSKKRSSPRKGASPAEPPAESSILATTPEPQPLQLHPATIPQLESELASALERHSRKCQICHHPDRDFIEDEFIHWIRPDYIVVKYDLHDRSYLYRHARALGLDMQRRRNLRQALEPILEQNQCVRVNAQSVLSAARIYSHINDDGQWQDPPRESIITKRPFVYAPNPPIRLRDRYQASREMEANLQSSIPNIHSNNQSAPSTSNLDPPSANPQDPPPAAKTENLIATPKRLETPVTPTKQTTGIVSNRHKNAVEKSTIRPLTQIAKRARRG